jgi:hypothetical protein
LNAANVGVYMAKEILNSAIEPEVSCHCRLQATVQKTYSEEKNLLVFHIWLDSPKAVNMI